METAVTSRLAGGTVPLLVTLTSPLLFCSRIGWFGESMVLKLTTPGREAVAMRFVSQLAGPSKWTVQGVLGAPPHVATAGFVKDQPGATRVITCTSSSLTRRVSMFFVIRRRPPTATLFPYTL